MPIAVSHGGPHLGSTKHRLSLRSPTPASLEGFSGDVAPDEPAEPDKNWFWSVVDGALHGISVIEQGFTAEGLGWVDDFLAIGGISDGGATAFMVNGVSEHDILKGAVGHYAHGSFRTSSANEGSWMADTFRSGRAR
ncbi:MAG: hypothetical protein M5R36_15365 [Deltaproteobacteria bacterium]|nr:hypothetical protein [Deltaproteobacteria bacterium]